MNEYEEARALAKIAGAEVLDQSEVGDDISLLYADWEYEFPDGTYISYDDWHPKTDIAQAMMVLEGLRAAHPDYYISLHFPGPTVREYRVKIGKYGIGVTYSIVEFGNTPEAAICAAVLKTREK